VILNVDIAELDTDQRHNQAARDAEVLTASTLKSINLTNKINFIEEER
jgi:hypothetical protein